MRTNNTYNNTNSNRTTQITVNVEECGPCPVFASFTLVFALQLREKHGKTSFRIRKPLVRLRKISVRLRKTSASVRKTSVRLTKTSVRLRKPSVSLTETSVRLRKPSVRLTKTSVRLRKPSARVRKTSVRLRKNLSQSTVYILPFNPIFSKLHSSKTCFLDQFQFCHFIMRPC